MSVLEARKVGYTYPGGTRALDGVDLAIGSNEFVALLGPVGCGKTTLLRIFAGFLAPESGTVTCDGEPGYVLQEEAIFPWMTVRENIEFGLAARSVAPEARHEVSDELLALIGLADFAEAHPKQLSSGMSKMVEVSRVLATDPAVLLLDEPFGALDAQTRARMQDALARLFEQKKKTVLFVTHDAEEAIYLADRIVIFTPRPARVKAGLPIAIPRPRSVETRFSPQFIELRRRIWEELAGPTKVP